MSGDWTTYHVYMSTSVVSVRVEGELKERLDALSASTGRPVAFYIREALTEHLADIEYGYQLRAEAEAVRRGHLDTIPSETVAAELFG